MRTRLLATVVVVIVSSLMVTPIEASTISRFAASLGSPVIEKDVTRQPSKGIGAIEGVVQIQEIAGVAGEVGAAITGEVLKGLLSSLADDLQKRINETGSTLLRDMLHNVQVAISQIDSTLGENIKKPIDELSDTMQQVISKATAVLIVTQNSLNATVSCGIADGKLLANETTANLKNTVNDITFWKEDVAYIAMSKALGSDSKFGLYVNREPTPFAFIGAYPDINERCGLPVVSLTNSAGEAVNVGAMTANENIIVANIPTVKSAGTYKVTISYKPRGFLHCKKPVNISTVLVVAPEPLFSIEYSATSTCGAYARRKIESEQYVNNSDCNGDKHLDVIACKEAGWEYINGGGIWTTNNYDKDKYMNREGDCYRAKSTIPEKGGIFCTGPGKWSGAKVWVEEQRLEPTIENPIAGNFSQKALYANTVKETIIDPTKKIKDLLPKDCNWTVSAKIVNPSGIPSQIPPWVGKGQGSSADAGTGASLVWTPTEGSLSITTPHYQCQYLQ